MISTRSQLSKPHITPLLTDTGLLADLRPLLGPA